MGKRLDGSSLFSGIGVDSVEMTYINSIMISVIFLSGVVSFWGYIIFDKIKKK